MSFNISEYDVNNSSTYAYQFPFLVMNDRQGNPVTGVTIGNGNFIIGNISNLTGDLVGKTVYLDATNNINFKTLHIEGGLVAGQTGTFDLELTDQSGNDILVTVTVTITQNP